MKITKHYLKQVINEELKYLVENQNTTNQLVGLIKKIMLFENAIRRGEDEQPFKVAAESALNGIKANFIPLIKEPDHQEMLANKLDNVSTVVNTFKKDMMNRRANNEKANKIAAFLDQLMYSFNIPESEFD